MRTKSLLAAAAIVAAGLASSLAQSNVYSLNVVGYVNRATPDGQFVLLSNPLDSGSNTLNGILPNSALDATVFKWDFAGQNLDAVSSTKIPGGWSPDLAIAPGEAFFYVSVGDTTNTFVGQVRQGALTLPIVGGGSFNAIGSLAPVGGTLNSLLNNPAADDTIFPWLAAPGGGDLDPQTSTYVIDANPALNSWTPNLPVNVADGFFYVLAGGNTNWVKNFTVQ